MNNLKKIKTSDGSFTLFNEAFGEACHSHVGAITEAKGKFIKPFFEHYKYKKPATLRVLDICYGMGVNTFTLVEQCRKLNIPLSISAVEYDAETIAYGRDYSLYFPQQKKDIENLILDRVIVTDNLKIELKVIDFVSYLLTCDDNSCYDFIMYDPFTPHKCPEQWTVELFKSCYRLLSDDGVLITYSSSKPVRAGLIESGFTVRETKAVGRKTGGTIAFKNREVISDKSIIDFYENSTARVPYRQVTSEEGLVSMRSEIIEKWNIEKEKLILSGEVISIKHLIKKRELNK